MAGFSAENNVFIARREVMLHALEEYHEKASDAKTPEEKEKLLLDAVDHAAKHNGRVDDKQKAAIALEWQGVIKENPGKALKLADSEPIKKLVADGVPEIPANVTVDSIALSSVDVSDPNNVSKLVDELGIAGALQLKPLAEINKQFEDAAQNTGFVDYARGETLTAKLDRHTPKGGAQITQKQNELQALPEEEEKDKKPSRPMNPMEMLFSVVMALLTGDWGALAGLFTKNNGQSGPDTAPRTARPLIDAAGKDRAFTKEEFMTNGKADVTKLTKATGANPDLDSDGALSKEEADKMREDIEALARSNPAIADIAASFKKATQGIVSSEQANASLPNTPSQTQNTGRQ